MKLNYKRVIFVGFAFFLISAFWQAYDTIVPKILTDKFGTQSQNNEIVDAEVVAEAPVEEPAAEEIPVEEAAPAEVTAEPDDFVTEE